jgi:Tol biopolymer transport system component
LNGANIQQLTRGGDDRHPSWSEDGRKIYFQRRLHDGSWDAYVMDSDGKNPTPLLRTYEENELSPVRRGTTDSFILAEGLVGEPTRVKVLDSATKAGRYLTSGNFGPETSPSISPDGALVSFLAPVSEEEPDRIGLWIIPFGH